MIDAEFPEPESLFPTDFDHNRILDLEIDKSFESETGIWALHRYKRDFVLIFIYLKYMREHKLQACYEFPTAEKVIEFLEKH